MKTKLFEVRDRLTFIPVIAIQLDPDYEEERYLLSRSGYGPTPIQQRSYVLLARTYGDNGQTGISCDPYTWGDRTMSNAHKYLIKNFDELESGAVIDVEYILGETAIPKVSELLE